jgi:hypothetical protein
MAAPVLERYAGNSASTTLSSAVSNSDTSFPLTSDTAFASTGGKIIIDEGTATEEYAYYTGKSGASLTVPLANRGLEGGSAQAHSSGATVKGVLTAGSMENIYTSLIDTHNATTGLFDTTKAYKIFAVHNLPEGTMYNGKIVPSVASNNLTVALKGMDGNDPSATNPVYVRINGVVRSITSALSVTKNAGTNWCNAGSAELATNEIDYFVYLKWDTQGYNIVDIAMSRMPFGKYGSDFGTGTTDERYIMQNLGFTTTDIFVNIGRFAATLSAGAGYTWSVPTFTPINLIQRPIYETGWLTWTPTVSWTAGTAPTGAGGNYSSRYKFVSDQCHIHYMKTSMTAGATVTEMKLTMPFNLLNPAAGNFAGMSGLISATAFGVNGSVAWAVNGGPGNQSLVVDCTSCAATAAYITGSYQI